MIRGLYTAASNMVVQLLRQEVYSTDLANVNTPGYKRDVAQTRETPETVIPGQFATLLDQATVNQQPMGVVGSLGSGVLMDPVVPEIDQGKMQHTGLPFDLALNGPGFFSVRGSNGQTWYSRAGDLQRSATGELRTSDGLPILNTNNQPVVIPDGPMEVTSDGTIFVNGQRVTQLAVVDVPRAAALRKVGQNTFVPQRPTVPTVPSATTGVEQGMLERSNVDPATTMTDSIAALRSYQESSQILQMQNQTLDRTVNDVGKV